MDNSKIIIILLCVIVALLVGILIFSPLLAKEDSNLVIADEKINVGDSLVVKLTDANGNPISNETVHIKFTDKKGIVTNEDVTTNSKGKAKFKMEEKGKYSVECSFDGNGKYASSLTVGNVSVKKPTTKLTSEEQTSTSTDSSSYYSSSGDYLEGPEVDSHGVTKEQVLRSGIKDVKYSEESGIYVSYDPNTGTYHD